MNARTSLKLVTTTLAALLAWGCASNPEVPPDAMEGEKDDEIGYLSLADEEESAGGEATDAPEETPARPAGGEGAGTAPGGGLGLAGGGAGGAGGASSGGLPRAVGPVATVNGEKITADEFNQALESAMASGRVPPRYMAQLPNLVLDQLIGMHLIEQAVERSDIEVTDKEIDAKIAEVRSDLERANAASNGQVGSFEAFMQQMGMDEKKLRESLRQSLAVEKILRKRGFDKPSDAELKKIYKENKDKLEKPASMRARHILVKVEPDADEKAWKKARAEAARLRALAVEEDADFAALAREHSRDSASASNGGDLGYFTRGHMVEAFEEASFALEEGEVSRPVRTRFGWHIIKAIDHRKADVPSFEKIAPQLRKQAESQALQAALKKYMMELRDQAKIQIHRENLEQ